MRNLLKSKIIICVALTGFFSGISVQAQEGANRALGAVTKIDAASRQLTLQTDAGAEVTISLDAKASFRRVAPGETNLQNASTIDISEIHAGDRVLARGKAGSEPNSLLANLVVVMSQADIANKQAADRVDWERRGVTGLVTEAAADHVTIQARGIDGVRQVLIQPAAGAVIRRYAPDSVRFADAKASSLAEIHKGDQVRARGDRSADGSQMSAEEIVSGAFRVTAGVITAVDAQEDIIRVNNLETKKPMAVKLAKDSTAKKLPAPLAQAIANRLHGVADAPIGGAAGAGGAGVSGGGRGGAVRGGDLQQMFDRAPAITLADLKAGDAIIVSSTVGANSDQVTAITLFAGVEPILTRPGTREMSLGDWNMGGDLGGFGQ